MTDSWHLYKILLFSRTPCDSKNLKSSVPFTQYTHQHRSIRPQHAMRNKRKRKKLSGFLGPGWLFHQINAPVYCKLSWRLVRFTGWKNMGKSFVGLESPDTFVVPVEGCDTALLPQRPQLDSTVWTAGNALKINKTSVRSDIINWTYCIDFSILA